MKNLEATKLAREAINEVAGGFHRGILYTNKYAECRTIKGYLSPKMKTKLQKALAKRFGAGNAPEFRFSSGMYSWSWDGVIVTLPFEKFPDEAAEQDPKSAERAAERKRINAITKLRQKIASSKRDIQIIEEDLADERKELRKLEASLKKALG